MDTISKLIQKFPQESLSILPTPLHFLPKLSELLGYQIYIKRDDLTGFALSGNKTRKLDFLIAEALAKKYTTIIGIGANQSNFCRILTNAAVRYGFKIHLVLRGKPSLNPTGNLRIDHLLGATIHHIDTTDNKVALAKAEELRQQLEAQGEKVFLLPPGGSIPTGALGYVKGWEEIYNQMANLPIKIETIFHASSSSGTQAGLVVGQGITGWKGHIIGISVDEPKEKLTENVRSLALATAKLIGIDIVLPEIEVDDNYIGDGYGIPTSECAKAIELFAKYEGIYLDYVYTGKAAAGLIDYCQKKRLDPDKGILFLHTGGYVQLFE